VAAKDDIPTLMRNVERASSERVTHRGAALLSYFTAA
jgi:hypothetical protein